MKYPVSLSASERESVFQVDDETLEYNIYTCQGRMITKLTNQGYTPYWCEKDEDTGRIIAAKYKVPFNGVSIRSNPELKPKKKKQGRKLTEKQIQKMQEGRRNKNT